ncbi:MAG: SoxR reducing system RseC family protein [Candidatus Brocadiaceae bacterium]|nr:SoxR reducing system RseC family protein [Candidatus Brocadiaceae bacterium]
MRRIVHSGSVVALEGERAVVQLVASEACQPGKFGCACCGSGQQEPRRIRVPRADLVQGDAVTVSIPVYVTYLATLAAFGLPAIGFLAGALIGLAVEGNQEAHGMPIIVGSFCGLAAGVGLSLLAEKHIGAGSYEVRRVSDAGS